MRWTIVAILAAVVGLAGWSLGARPGSDSCCAAGACADCGCCGGSMGSDDAAPEPAGPIGPCPCGIGLPDEPAPATMPGLTVVIPLPAREAPMIPSARAASVAREPLAAPALTGRARLTVLCRWRV